MTRRRRGPHGKPNGRHVRTVHALRQPVPAALAMLCALVWMVTVVAVVVAL